MSDFQYTVKSGDTLSKIAAMFTIGGTAYTPAIANYNSIDNPNLIQVGQTINIPANWLKPALTGDNVPQDFTPTPPMRTKGPTIPPIVDNYGKVPNVAANMQQKKMSMTTMLLLGAAGLLLVGIILRKK